MTVCEDSRQTNGTRNEKQGWRRADLLDERVDTHDGVHPFPARAFLVPVLITIWRDGLFCFVFVYGDQDDRKSGRSNQHDAAAV